jgi:hypothetical protein
MFIFVSPRSGPKCGPKAVMEGEPDPKEGSPFLTAMLVSLSFKGCDPNGS